ncbi:MAG: Txe/YoeB family addiction module toxin [Geminicoccaceae bacterium]
MTLTFSSRAWSDYLEWANEAGTRQGAKMLARVNRLIEEAVRSPGDGIGKPEPLRGQLSGCSSRRITEEHRLVYRHTGAGLDIIACRYHYTGLE